MTPFKFGCYYVLSIDTRSMGFMYVNGFEFVCPIFHLDFYNLVCNAINTAGVTSGAGTANPSGAPEFTPRFLVGIVLLDL